MNQLFIISDEAWAGATPQEVQSICSVLKELSLYSLPYPEVDIGISIDAAVVWTDTTGKPSNDRTHNRQLIAGKAHPPLGPQWLTIYRGVTLTGFRDSILCGPCSPHWKGNSNPLIATMIRDLLIALLATRNVRKSTHINKLSRLGIGKKKQYINRYTYTTTLALPSEASMEDDAEHPPGKKKCPHLRRGHIRRNQHFGPQRQFTKSIWIAPIFVNASEEFTKQRQAYNLSMPAKQLEPTEPGILEPIS